MAVTNEFLSIEDITWSCSPQNKMKIFSRNDTVFGQTYSSIASSQCWEFCSHILWPSHRFLLFNASSIRPAFAWLIKRIQQCVEDARPRHGYKKKSGSHISLANIVGTAEGCLFFFFLFWRRSSTVTLIPVYDPRDPRRSKIFFLGGGSDPRVWLNPYTKY